jgi:hypothetical protein
LRVKILQHLCLDHCPGAASIERKDLVSHMRYFGWTSIRGRGGK